MKRRTRLLWVIAGLAAVFVAISVIAQAVSQASWEPIALAGWIPAVIIAAWPGTGRRCSPRRGRQPRAS